MPKASSIGDLYVKESDPLIELGKQWRSALDKRNTATRTAVPLYRKRDATVKERRYMAAALHRADNAAAAMRDVENFAIDNPPSSIKGALVVAEMIFDLVDHNEPEGALVDSLIKGLRNLID